MTLMYSRFDATKITDPDTGEEYSPDETGAFDVPPRLAEVLERQHLAGERAWETSPEKQAREQAEADARRRDPLALIEAVEKLQGQAVETPTTDDEKKLRAAMLRAEADKLDPPVRKSRRR